MKNKVNIELNSILLKYAAENGMLVWTDLDNSIMKTREEILKQHNHTITQREDGRWCTKLGQGHPYKQIVRKNKKDVEDIVIEYYVTDEKKQITLEECFNEWMRSEYESVNPALSYKSLTNYTAEFKRFVSQHAFAKSIISNMTEREVRNFFDDLIERKEKITRKRLNSVKTLIAGAINYAKSKLDLDALPINTVLKEIKYKDSQFAQEKKTRKVFYQHELVGLLNYLYEESSLICLGIILTAQTGLRVSEISALSWENVYPDKLYICAGEHTYTKFDGTRVEEVGLPKKMKCRMVTLSDEAKDTIKLIRKIHPTQTGFVFLRNDGRRANTRAFDYLIKKACRKSGIIELPMHRLRNTYTSVMLAQGVPEKLVQEQLGHKEIQTTQKHYNFNPFMESECSAIFKNRSVLISAEI